jgi:hypothetical protein
VLFSFFLFLFFLSFFLFLPKENENGPESLFWMLAATEPVVPEQIGLILATVIMGAEFSKSTEMSSGA